MNNKKNDVFNSIFSDMTDAKILGADLRHSVSKAIIAKRTELGFSQTEFAKFMNVSQAMVSKWESYSYNFSLDTIGEIFSKLNVEIEFKILSKAEEYRKNVFTDFNFESYPTGNILQMEGEVA